MTIPTLGKAVDGGEPVVINMAEVIGTDIGVIAKKGFGKSGLLRVLFEQTRPLIQQIILDPEGEFFTLREKAEYLVAGGENGDCPATPSNAAALARMLMENPGISAVIQLDHLKGGDPQVFVALFIEAIMETPKAHWHPVMICIDETQRFAPQDGKVASSEAVEDMVQRGRKRGITPVFATLRNAAIDKNLTDGISTWFFGRVGTDIDRKIVTNSLAMTSSSAESRDLPFLPKRRFWGFGNAIGDRPVLFDVADAETTIIKSGGALVAMPPPPKSLGPMLAAMAKAAEPPKEGGRSAEAEPFVRQMPEAVKEAIRKEAYADGYNQGHFDGRQDALAEGERQGVLATLASLALWIDQHRPDLDPAPLPDFSDADFTPLDRPEDRPGETDHAQPPGLRPRQPRQRRAQAAISLAPDNPATMTTPAAAQAFLRVLGQSYPAPLTWAQAASLAGRKPRGGSFAAAKKWMKDEGLIEEAGDRVALTPKGRDVAPMDDLPESALEMWLRAARNMPPPAADILQYLIDNPGKRPEEIAEALGRQARGGSWSAGMGFAKKNGLIEADDDGYLSIASHLKD